MKRLDSLLLAGVGVLVVHQLSYTASAVIGYESSVAHGHLAFAWLIGSLLALLGLAMSVRRSLRSRNHTVSGFPTLLASIALGYVAMEGIERSLDGIGAVHLVSEPVFWLGLAASPLVAFALRWSVQITEQLARWIATSEQPSWPRIDVRNDGATSIVLPTMAVVSAATPRRGPPVR